VRKERTSSGGILAVQLHLDIAVVGVQRQTHARIAARRGWSAVAKRQEKKTIVLLLSSSETSPHSLVLYALRTTRVLTLSEENAMDGGGASYTASSGN
jgi:hypothetical protein